MTGSQTDPIEVPLYEQAICLLLELCPALMACAMASDGGPLPGEEAFERWWVIRKTVEVIRQKKRILLNKAQCSLLTEAMEFAHAYQHGRNHSLPEIEICPCFVAGILRQFKEVLDAEAGIGEECAAHE